MSLREQTDRILDPASAENGARLFRLLQYGLIAAGLLDAVFGTMPDARRQDDTLLTVAAVVLAVAFAIEYVARIYVAPVELAAHELAETGSLRPRTSFFARLEYAVSPLGLIDLAAAAPVLIVLALGFPSETARLFGILWILKLVRYTPAFSLVGRVIQNERHHLLGVLLAFFIVLLLAATGGYLLERHHSNQEAFRSIPAALWWAINTLTTTGNSDAIPVTSAGKVLGAVLMACGIATFALWAGIIANGFMQEIRRRDFLRTWQLVAKVPLFQAVSAGTIAEVARLLRPEEIPGGRVVIRRGRAGDCMYFIAQGEVEVHTKPPVRLGPGAFFGEMALIRGGPRTDTVTTTSATTLLRLDVVDFRGLAETDRDLAAAIHGEAERRAARRARPAPALRDAPAGQLTEPANPAP